MEQITMNALLNSVQIAAERQPAETAGAADKSGQSDFRKLMDQQQKQQQKTDGEDGQQTGSTEKDTSAPVSENPKVPAGQSKEELEQQMVLAAMAMLQNPVVAEIAEETPQVLSDPSWEEGLVPVGYDDNLDLGVRTVHWIRPFSEGGEALEDQNAVASEWIEAQSKAEAAPEEAPLPTLETGSEEFTAEVKVEVKAEEALPEQKETEDGGEDPLAGQESGVEAPVFRDVQEIPVKVGEAPAAEEPAEAKPVEVQVGEQLAKALETGETKVELQLTPENLGRVQVEITLREDGTLHVELHAENSRTQNLLEKNLDGLQALLGRTGQQEVRVEVQHQQESQRQNFYDQQQQNHQGGQPHSQQERRERREEGEDFLHQLRLGLVPVDGEER